MLFYSQREITWVGLIQAIAPADCRKGSQRSVFQLVWQKASIHVWTASVDHMAWNVGGIQELKAVPGQQAAVLGPNATRK